jgi:uncharacterized protein YbjT (DUF2867 family)
LARDPDRAARLLEREIEIVRGDLTRPETLLPAVDGVDHIIFTAGAPSGRYAPERLVRQTDYQGVLDTLAAARHTRFHGRFLYMNSIGIKTHSVSAWLINLLKRSTLVWRRKVEEELRTSGVNYTILSKDARDRPGARGRTDKMGRVLRSACARSVMGLTASVGAARVSDEPAGRRLR